MVKPKKFLALVLVLGILMSLFSTFSFAEEKTYGNFRYIEENGAVTITDYDDGGTGNGALNIPNEINGLPVRSVSSNVCWNNNNLTSIHIPANLQSLDDTALRACYGVTKITVDENNPYFDSRNNCNAVIETATNTLLIACQRTVVPEGITTIGVNAYLRTAELPDSVTKLCNGAFVSTTSVTYIKLPANLLEIEYGALSRCLVSVFIPASVTHIGNYNFDSGSLQSVHYAGTQEQWKKITIDPGNGDLSTANIHYESHGDPNAENVHGYQDIQSVTFGAYRPLYRGAEDSPFDCLKADILFSDNSTCTCVFGFSYSDDEDYQYNNNGITYHDLHQLSFDVHGDTSEVYFTVSGNPDTDDSVTVTINGLGKKSYTYNAQFELPVEDSPVDYIEILDEEIEVNIHSLQPDTRVGDGLYECHYDRPVCIHFKDGSAMNTDDMYGGSGWGFDGIDASLFVAREAPFPGIDIHGNALYRLAYISNQSQQPWTTPGKYPVTVCYMGREAVYYVNVVDNSTSINTGETKTFFIENNSSAQFSYTPEESGNYRIYFYCWQDVVMQDHTVGVSINGENLSWQFDESHGERFYIEYTFEEGEQYLFSVSDSSPIDDVLSLPIRIEKYTGGDPDDPDIPYTVVDEGLIAAGQTKHLYIDNFEYHDFTFVPEADGYYEFSSSGDADTYATLFATDGDESWYDDDGGNDFNFCITTNLTAGTQYTLRIGVYSNGDSDITVKKQRGIKSITYTPAEKIMFLEEAGAGYYSRDEENKTYFHYNLDNYHSDGFCSGDRLTIVYEDGTQTYTFSANKGWEAENGDIFTDRLQIEEQQEQQHWGVGKENVFYLQYRGIRSNPIPVTILPNSQLDDEFGYRVGENNTCRVLFYKGNQTQVSVPQTIQGYTVVGIDAAFSGNKTVTGIELPDTLTAIYSYAFSGCERLRQIAIPDSVTFIGWYAFEGTAITEITIPEGVDGVEGGTFSHCLELKRVNLPNSLQYIGDSAFYSSGIEKVNLPKALDSIDFGAFAYCESLTEVDIPNSVTIIGNDAFSNCSELTKVRIPYNLSYFGSAFEGCRKLTNVMIPEGVQRVESGTFLDTGLKEVVIPKSVTYIGSDAFGYTFEEHFDEEENYYWYEHTPMEGFTVKGYRGSAAQQYAVENGFTFVALDDAAVLYLPQLFNTQTSLTLKNGEREYCAESSTGLFILSDVSQEQAYNVFVNTKHSITACAATEVLAANGKWTVLSTAQLPAVGDVNGDGVIDLADISLLLSSSVYGVENSEYDLDNDGVVALTDIAIVLQEQNYSKSSDVM